MTPDPKFIVHLLHSNYPAAALGLEREGNEAYCLMRLNTLWLMVMDNVMSIFGHSAAAAG